jgi:tetratricopeptide (TPR) repeat protein
MTLHLPSVPSARAASPAEALLSLALGAHKSGTLGEIMRTHRHASEWVSRRFLRPVVGAAGDTLAEPAPSAQAMGMFLHWAIRKLRPDQASPFAPIDRRCWLDHTSWRPMLAVMCHYGFEGVPDFSDRYRRRADESAVDNLCGLWSVGSSTFYRYLDKGKRLLAESLPGRGLSGWQCVSLRECVDCAIVARTREREDPTLAAAWHRRQAEQALVRRDPPSALWHLLHVDDPAAFVSVIKRFRVELAASAETPLLVDRFAAQRPLPQAEFDLLLAKAGLWRAVGDEERERTAYEQALRLAASLGDRRLLGAVYGELGRFHEVRDVDKALACLEDSAEFLRQAEAAARESGGDGLDQIVPAYVDALQKLAWAYVLRNDARCSTVLEMADKLWRSVPVPEESVALIEQTWGEYWRRAGKFAQAIGHKHRALNIFERLGDTRQILSTYNNLSLLYGEADDPDRSIDYAQRVLDMARTMPVEPYILTNTWLNLGVAHFWHADYAAAIEGYGQALRIALEAGLHVNAHRAHYNLAEAHYKQFLKTRDPEQERLGDEHAAAAIKAQATQSESWIPEGARRLKSEILGTDSGLVLERLAFDEKLAHPQEMAEIQRHRTALALPDAPQAHIRAHLAIANAYLAISAKEREAALALIQRHELGAEFEAQIDALHITFTRELTREKTLMAQWKQKTYGVLTDERANVVLKAVLEAGSINKSGYANLCQVGLATASKHLGTLAERGLLVQTGKGPSTRYVLP